VRRAVAAVGLVAALAVLEPMAAEAGGGLRGGQSRGNSGHGYNSHRYGQPHYYQPYYYQPYYYRPYYWPYYYRPHYFSGFYFGPPAYVVTPGYLAPAYASPGYDPGAPPGFYSAPSAPELQREVVFPEGRYFLQGDGDTVPYHWVWVPNPPSAPPPDTPDPR